MNDPTNGVPSDDLTDMIGTERDPLDHLAEEFSERCRRGESPTISEYEARYPDQADRVRKLLGAVAMMEQLRRGSRVARSMPERLGEFRILRELGRGGMGVVYEAVQESLDRHVAVKAMHHVHLDPKRLKRFQREAHAVAQLHHTNIVPIFGVGEHEGLPYYVMQIIRGSGLDDLLQTWRREGSPRAPDRWRFAAKVGVQAAEALHYAHGQGVLHRDVKPANLLLDEHDTVWITDFGLAKLSGREDLTGSGDVIGTLRYLAPEVLRGESDARSDVYSLGLTLYELLTLAPPYGELSPSELLRRVSEGHPITPRRLEPAIPADLETIILKAIAREPEHRYASAGEMAEDLRSFLQDRPIRARRANLAERGYRWGRRNRALAALMATAAASLVLAAVMGWVGYVRTHAALGREELRRGEAEAATKRAEANVALSLEVFGALFDKLALIGALPSPPLGLLSRRGSGGVPKGFGHGPGGPGPGPGEFGMHGLMGPPPDGGGPMDGGPRGGGPRASIAANDTRLLESVLSFYDKFAAQNATNPRLQGEAAWAYRKVAWLHQRLGQDEESEAAVARAIGMFEELARQFPGERLYRLRLVETYLVANPWTAPMSTLGALETRFRLARELADALAAESPDDEESAQAGVAALVMLGVALQRLDRSALAEACQREAIARADALIARLDRPERVQLDRASAREALAVLLVSRDRGPEALAEVEAIVADLKTLSQGRMMKGPIGDGLDGAAELYRTLGESAKADAMDAWSRELHRGPDGGPGGRMRTGPPEGF